VICLLLFELPSDGSSPDSQYLPGYALILTLHYVHIGGIQGMPNLVWGHGVVCIIDLQRDGWIAPSLVFHDTGNTGL